jgi:EmrB/QacA subfamily drug resistance transporter
VEGLSHKQKMTVMFALIAAMFFAAINQTIVSSSMPRIVAELGGMDHYSWVVTIFMLTSSIATILVGKLSDIYGRKPFLIFGILLFMVGTFLVGLSSDIYQMITYRAIQGFGAGVLMSVTMTAVGDLFAPRERAKWSGVMMAVFGLSSILGPVLGGVMIDHMAWKWLFWSFLPVGLIALVMIGYLFPKVKRTNKDSIDYWGSLFLSASVVALLLGVSWGGSKYAWGSPTIIGLFSATIVGIGILILIERKVSSPVLPLSMFKSSIVNVSNIAGFIMNGGMMGVMIYLPIYLQGVKGLTPTESGLVNIPMSITMMLLSTLAGRWITKSGKYKRYALIGLSIMSGSMVLLANMNSIGFALVCITIFGIGLGLAIPVFTLTVQNALPPSQLGVATSTATLFRNLGGTIFIALFGSIMNTAMRSNMEKEVAAIGGLDFSQIDPTSAGQLNELLSPEILLDQHKLANLQETLPDDVLAVFSPMIELLRNALGDTLSTLFYLGAITIAFGVIVTLFLREIPLRTSDTVASTENKQAAS